MAYARGLLPIRNAAGDYNGTVETCQVLSAYATAVFTGDTVVWVAGGGPVVTSTTHPMGSEMTGESVPTVQVTGAGGVIYGVVVGIEPNRNDLSQNNYIPASTGGLVKVLRATPEQLFYVGEDGTSDAIELIDIGNTFDLAAGAGSTTTGYSGYVLDSDSQATTAKQVYLRGCAPIPGNVDNVDTATATDTIWICSIMEIQFGQAPVGVGV